MREEHGKSGAAAEAREQHRDQQQLARRRDRDRRHLWRIDDLQLDPVGLDIRGGRDLHRFLPREQILVLLPENLVVAVEIDEFRLQAGLRARQGRQAVSLGNGGLQLALERERAGRGVDQLQLELVIDRVGKGLADHGHRDRSLACRLGGQRGNQLACVDHGGIGVGVALAKLGQMLLRFGQRRGVR
jgi:hypothetical protein